MLAQKPTKVITDPRKYLTLVYGEAGVGKTSFAAQIEGHYFLSAEVGTSGVEVYGSVIDSWETYITTCKELKGAVESGFKDQREIKTIVIDTYDALWALASQYVMKNESFIIDGRPTKFKRVDDVVYGKAYSRTNQTVIDTIRHLRALGYGVLLLAHQREKPVTWRGQKLTALGLQLSESSQDAIVNECDAVGWAMIEETIQKDDKLNVVSREEGRYIYWQPTFLRIAKHRLNNFPEKLPLPRGRGWQTYVDQFNRTLEAEMKGGH